MVTEPLKRLRREYLFAFGHLAGLRPRDVDELILSDFAALIDDIDEHVRIISKGSG